PYKEVLTAIVVRRDFEDITDLKDLAKRKVALAKGDSLVAILKKSVPDAHQILYDDYQEVLKAVAFGQVDVAVTELPLAAYQIRSLSLTNLKITAGLSNLGDRDQRYRLAVRKDWPLLISILEKAMESLTPEELKQLDDKWMALPARVEAPVQLQLTEQERQWLEQHPVIRVAIDRNWAPVEFVDEKGIFQGISADYIESLEDLLGVKFKAAQDLSWQETMAAFKRGELDMFTSLRSTSEREKFFEFTDVYTSFPIAIFTGPEVPFIGSMKEMNGRRVGVVEGYVTQELLAANHPRIVLVATGDTVDALERLSRGELDAYVGNTLVTGYYLGKLGYTRIKVAGETPYRYNQSMGVRKDWPIFVSILNKALEAIPAAEHNAIYSRWISVRYEHGFDYSLLWKVLVPVFVIIVLFVYWNRRLSAEVARRVQTEEALQKANIRLKELDRLKSTFLASMSHELRTPLNSIIGFTGIMLQGMAGEINEEQRKQLTMVENSARHLLSLINDVLDISKVEAGKVELSLEEFRLDDIAGEVVETLAPAANRSARRCHALQR
ncbi:MAG: transporter substrate-binding domain-containing protein, partial [Deltaproteobacteria bacterium]|nr:transporter substrate-binding domain-containing protein [Deltaproteobacteria bacterium]